MLPAESTIQSWLRVIEGEPGFTAEAFDSLKNQVKHRNEPLAVNLVTDEMSIRERIGMGNDGKIYGCVNLGSNITIEADTEDLPKAKNALVFLAVSLKYKFKIPLGYFMIDSMIGKERAHLLTMCLNLLHEVNTHVVSLTFDGAAVNFNTCKELGANLDYQSMDYRPYFPHPKTQQPVYIYPDPSHMLKNVRNAFAEFGPLTDGNGEEINWLYISKLHELQAKQGLHFGNKLRKKHILFKDCKMKVKLAAQVLSESVHDSLEELKNKGYDQFEHCSATANFCKKFDQVFDLLNCRQESRYNTVCKPLKVPITDQNKAELKNKAEELEKYLVTLKASNGTPLIQGIRRTGFLGFIMCLRNVFNIFDSLKAIPEYNFVYLLSFKLSQDHLENFFSAVRRKNGWNNNPDALQFKGAYRQLLARHQINSSKRGNCAKDDVPILSVSSRKKKKLELQSNPVNVESRLEADSNYGVSSRKNKKTLELQSNPTNVESDFESDPDNELAAYDSDPEMHDYESDIEIESNEIEVGEVLQPGFETFADESVLKSIKLIVPHIAGFVVKSISKKIACDNCRNILENPSPPTFEQSLTARKSHGRLKHPSNEVVKLCLSAEMNFRNLGHQIFKPTFNEEVKALVLREYANGLSCGNLNHRDNLLDSIIQKYIKVRMHHELSEINFNNTTSFIRQKFTKLVHFLHK